MNKDSQPMTHEELVNYFVTAISGHEKEVEIALILSLYTAFGLKPETMQKFPEVTEDEIAKELQRKLLHGDTDEEDEAWEMIFDTIGTDKAWHIISNINDYIKEYNELMDPLDKLWYKLLKMYVS